MSPFRDFLQGKLTFQISLTDLVIHPAFQPPFPPIVICYRILLSMYMPRVEDVAPVNK